MNTVLPRAGLLEEWRHTLKQALVSPDKHPLRKSHSEAGSIWESVFESSFFLLFQRRAACRPGYQEGKAPFSPDFLSYFFFNWLTTNLKAAPFGNDNPLIEHQNWDTASVLEGRSGTMRESVQKLINSFKLKEQNEAKLNSRSHRRVPYVRIDGAFPSNPVIFPHRIYKDLTNLQPRSTFFFFFF